MISIVVRLRSLLLHWKRLVKTVRKILEKERNISITVYFRGGDYFIKNSVVFDSLDSGTQDHPVTYSAYNNEAVSFSGGISIPVKYATPVKDNLVLNRFPSHC